MTKKSRVVFISGASSGIGRAAVIAFIKNGDDVVGFARREAKLKALADEIQAYPEGKGRFLAVQGDITERESVEAAFAELETTFKKLDIVIANAGIGQRGALGDADWQDIEQVLRTNIDGVIHSIQVAVPLMRLNPDGGQIITISSVAATLISPYTASYAASKAFVSSLTASIRVELKHENIRVTDFLIGRTATEFNEKRLGEGKRKASKLPEMNPDEVAEALVRASYKNQGKVIMRLLDRLIIWGNRLIPGIMGKMAAAQYK
ncbi:SDR family oxidoreductase [Anaerolineales bacterium]